MIGVICHHSEIPAMQRSAALTPLSREHHTALSLAQQARKVADDAAPAVVQAMAERVRARFECDLQPHFDEEERWLLPALQRVGQQELVTRTLSEHRQLQQLAERLSQPEVTLLHDFAERLIAHVRFEERELFPCAERYPEILAAAPQPPAAEDAD